MPKGLHGFQKGNKIGHRFLKGNNFGNTDGLRKWIEENGPWNKGKKGVKKWTAGQRKKFLDKMVGHPGWNTGKHTNSEEYKEVLRQRMRGNKYSYKNGNSSKNELIRKGIESRIWRESVFSRDGWTCQKYGTVGGELHAHHILNFSQYPELRFAIDNGITLSKKAHKEFHKKYGMTNNTREQLNEFICQI